MSKYLQLNDLQISIIIEQYLRGLNPREISLAFAEKTGREIKVTDVNKVLSAQRADWRSRKEAQTEYLMQVEIDHLRMMEREAWRQYESAGGRAVRETVNELFDDQDNIVERRVQTISSQDTKTAHQWFESILKIREKLRKLLKLEQNITFNANLIGVKTYQGGWSPDRWPDPPQVSEGETIEGETVE